MEAFKPLQHMTNMEISYAIIGTSIVAADLSEGFLEAANKPKAAKVIKKALPVVGAITATGLQLFLESRKVVNWDTLDSSDAIYGIAVIAPAYFAARHFLSKNLHLKEKGVALFGKFNKKVESPSEIILPEDLAVIESKTITED
ncbi:hypothetical protein A2859_04380 [Candidatus Roizmanbacteria bacterium RIFCSPHIGHO2_01_FULL_37_16b]|nr:MAG: hypothetical protein A2859_04380 [Candidatus Roizmanbacteria bacterium RIFCSPHIGHO2_01_FULL_37_16b]